MERNADMKFGKEFKKQKVPEWTEAYVDYNGLKRILQEIRRIRQKAGNLQNSEDIENPVIAVNTVQQKNYRNLYNTKLLVSPEEVEENEIIFFKKLDDELNKANTFYKDKVEEVMREATLLNTQMDALIALRIKVMNPGFHGSSSLRRLPTDIENLLPSKVTSPKRAKTFGVSQMDMRLGVEVSCKIQQGPDSPSVVEHMNVTPEKRKESDIHSESDSAPVAHYDGASIDEANSSECKTTQLEILDRVKISNNCETPISTIKGVLKDSKENDLSFKKDELREVEERLKRVFVEFYHKLRLLKNYR
ncbi:Phosphate transporter PHO1-like protein 10 [Forsythia ovata]|uniref:Phosphate transporter PHO1-like protein 10 n=1 Tax=Forsythia ovata TaxID=205694 RepID=A0ABD1WAP0_9LAMI